MIKHKFHKFHKNLVASFSTWLPLGFAITVVFGFIYVSNQFQLRSEANDPQVSIVDDVANAMNQGVPYEAFRSSNPVEITQSLAPYLVVYTPDHQPVGGNGMLHGKPPHLPLGVFEYAKAHGEYHVTWEPEPGVREAVVLRFVNGMTPGYVLVGRSLSEVEARTSTLFHLSEMGWGLAMLGSLACTLFLS